MKDLTESLYIKDSIEEIKERVFIMSYLLNPPKVILSTQPYGFHHIISITLFTKTKNPSVGKLIPTPGNLSFLCFFTHLLVHPRHQFENEADSLPETRFGNCKLHDITTGLNALSDIIVEMEEKIEEVKSMFFTTYL